MVAVQSARILNIIDGLNGWKLALGILGVLLHYASRYYNNFRKTSSCSIHGLVAVEPPYHAVGFTRQLQQRLPQRPADERISGAPLEIRGRKLGELVLRNVLFRLQRGTKQMT